MMPVVRLSEVTWNRLKGHARPLEDSVDDVVNRALDALDSHSPVHEQNAVAISPPRARSSGPKLPQKEFRNPLLEVLRQLGGSGRVRDIRTLLETRVRARLS